MDTVLKWSGHGLRVFKEARNIILNQIIELSRGTVAHHCEMMKVDLMLPAIEGHRRLQIFSISTKVNGSILCTEFGITRLRPIYRCSEGQWAKNTVASDDMKERSLLLELANSLEILHSAKISLQISLRLIVHICTVGRIQWIQEVAPYMQQMNKLLARRSRRFLFGWCLNI